MKTFTEAHEKAKKLRKQNSKDSIVNISKILHILNKEEFDPTTQYNYTQRWNIAVKVANLLTSSTNNTEINHSLFEYFILQIRNFFCIYFCFKHV